MKNFKTIFKNFITLEWYYHLTIMLTTVIIVALFVKFLIWIIPILLEVREPFLVIKIRLIASNEMLVQKQHKEEDF